MSEGTYSQKFADLQPGDPEYQTFTNIQPGEREYHIHMGVELASDPNNIHSISGRILLDQSKVRKIPKDRLLYMPRVLHAIITILESCQTKDIKIMMIQFSTEKFDMHKFLNTKITQMPKHVLKGAYRGVDDDIIETFEFLFDKTHITSIEGSADANTNVTK